MKGLNFRVLFVAKTKALDVAKFEHERLWNLIVDGNEAFDIF